MISLRPRQKTRERKKQREPAEKQKEIQKNIQIQREKPMLPLDDLEHARRLKPTMDFYRSKRARDSR